VEATANVSEVRITVRDNGNYKVEGPVTLVDGEGSEIAVPAGKAVFLCRCGQSKTKPFCDSSHREAGFESVVRAGDLGA
jgi:CDGSH iron-sulfur domain-containing protein 3